MRFVIFLTIAILIILGVHAFIGWRLAVPFQPTWRRLIYGLVALSMVALPTLLVTGNLSSTPGTRDLLSGSAFWLMGLFSLVFAGVFTLEMVKLLALGIDRVGALVADYAPIAELLPDDPSKRRTLLAGLHVGLLGGVGLQMATTAMTNARGFKVVEVDVPIRGLPAALSGFRIVQVSDIHVGPLIRNDFVRHMVDTINGLKPDLVAITGDLVDGSVDELAKDVAPLTDIQSRHGSLFITGNHEYYSGAHEWLEHVRTLGIRTLLNEHVDIDHDGARLVIGGVNDITGQSMVPEHTSDIGEAFRGAPSGPRVLLAHQPRSVLDAVNHEVDLQLSGHTHGGQYFPGTLLIRLAHPYVRGLALHAKRTWIYVSCGTAWWGPPMRSSSVPAEVTLVRLVPETELARVDGVDVPGVRA